MQAGIFIFLSLVMWQSRTVHHTTYDSITLYIALDGKASMERTVPDVCDEEMLLIVMKVGYGC